MEPIKLSTYKLAECLALSRCQCTNVEEDVRRKYPHICIFINVNSVLASIEMAQYKHRHVFLITIRIVLMILGASSRVPSVVTPTISYLVTPVIFGPSKTMLIRVF